MKRSPPWSCVGLLVFLTVAACSRRQTDQPTPMSVVSAVPTNEAADASENKEPMSESYQPCPPAGEPCRILPLGDSITYGMSSTTLGGYRLELFRRARQRGRNITFVGSVQSGPQTVDGVPFPRANEGHSGFTIEDGGGRSGIGPLVVSSMRKHRPHIVLLMIGTNDLAIGFDLPSAPKRLAALVDRILDVDPTVLLVMAQITPTNDDPTNVRVAAYNAAMPQIASARAKAGRHVRVVDMFAAFTARPGFKQALLADALHPNDAGFRVMADVWERAIGEVLR